MLLLIGGTRPGFPGPHRGPAGAADATTLRGQVVCGGCWEEADRTKVPYGTDDDLRCAERCDKNGVAAALAVDEKGSATLYRLEDGAFKRTGKGWLAYMARRVEVTGAVRTEKGKPVLRVDALKVLGK